MNRLHIDRHREQFHRYNSVIFKDRLALDRTAAANKRTLYAFMRTTLDFNVSGLVFIRFFNYEWIMLIGWAFLVISVILGGYGIARYFQVKRHYLKINKKEVYQKE